MKIEISKKTKWLTIPIILVLLIGGIVSANVTTDKSASIVGNNTPQVANAWVTCTPNEVLISDTTVVTSEGTDGRVHVRCKENYGWGIYFAVPPYKPALASSLVEMASEAMYRGKSMSVMYDANDLSGPSFGCSRGNCRPLKIAYIRP